MGKIELLNKFSRAMNETGFQIKKHSPEIFLVIGSVGVVASAVMACKATTKLSTILDETKETIDKIHETAERAENDECIEYTVEDSKKDLAITYAQTGVKLAKLYGPAVIIGTLSLTSIFASNNILRQRNVALAAAYATIDKSFKQYRGRVIDRFGAELDQELRHNIKAMTVEEVIVDEKGKEKTVKKTVNAVNPNDISDYARVFDKNSDCWEDNPEYNLTFLKAQQRYFNDLLIVKKRVFLNEVYDALGLPRSKAGQIVGWKYDPTNPDIDSVIDFHIYDIYRTDNGEFINGNNPNVLLDFNVDGNVWEDM